MAVPELRLSGQGAVFFSKPVIVLIIKISILMMIKKLKLWN